MQRDDLHTDESVTWEETLSGWRGPVRVTAAIALIAALVVIAIRTLSERGNGATEAYLGGMFFAVIAVGIAIGAAILTSD